MRQIATKEWRDLWQEIAVKAARPMQSGSMAAAFAECLGDMEVIEDEVKRLQAEVKSLQAIADAAESFCAVPPDGLADYVPFQQYTTVSDCRALVKAFAEVKR